MIGYVQPLPHPVPHVDAIRGYITRVGDALQAHGVSVADVWLDPCAPRDATFVLDHRAVVWNESEGFVLGEFVSGAPGVRTVLRDPAGLGGGVLPDPRAVPHLLDDLAREAARRARPVAARSFDAGHDGFDDRLARYDLP